MPLSADVSCSLLEIDYSGIEAVLTGWCINQHLGDSAGAKDYIRKCRLGLHAIVTAIKVGQPINLARPDAEIAPDIARIKKEFETEYDTLKRVVHGTHYGLTPFGMVEMFPDYFRSVKEAEDAQNFLFIAAPSLPTWQTAVRRRAREIGYLGGLTMPPTPPSAWDHPFGYKHWFWDVLSYRPIDEVGARKWLKDPRRANRIIQLHGRWFKIEWGGDSKRTCAFYPQSIGAGCLKRAEMKLFHPDSPTFIGDAYFGRTPLLHPIHDSLLLHVPTRLVERVAAIAVDVMQSEIDQLPIPVEWGMGRYLRIGVEAKAGKTWDKRDMEKLKVAPIVYGVEHPEDAPVLAREDADAEEWDSLAREVA